MKAISGILAAIVALAAVGTGVHLLNAHDADSPNRFGALRATEVQANTYTFSSQEDPSVAVDGDGRVLSTWSSRRQELGTYGVFAQLLDPLGRQLGTEIHVNETLPGAQQDAYATFAPDGSAWVAWSSRDRRTENNGIFLRRLMETETGFQPVGAEIHAGGEPEDLYTDPAIAVNGKGELLVVWERNELDRIVIAARRFSATGEPVADAFRLSNVDAGQERMPDVVALPDDGFLVVWQRADAASAPLGIFARRLSSDGELSRELLMNDLEDLQHVEPSLDVDAEGRGVVAWMSASGEAGDWEVRARQFDPQGQPLGASFVVDAGGEGYRNGATAVCAPDGRFLVAYNSHDGVYTKEDGRPARQVDIRARVFDADALPVGEGCQVNNAQPGRHAMQIARNGRHAVWSGAGPLAFAWAGKAEFDGSGIAVRIFTPEGFDAPAPPGVTPRAACADLTSGDMARTAPPDPLPDWRRRLDRIAPMGPRSNGFVGHDQTGWAPPDPDLAVGPDRIVSSVNCETACLDKNGVELWRQINYGPGGFWVSLGAQDFVFDPVALYDWHSDRFIIANSELASNGDYICLAVSKDSSPDDANDWWKFRVKVSPTCSFPDFPNLGVNQDYIYITTDCFYGGGNRVIIFDKANVLHGNTVGTWWNSQMSSSLQSLGNTKNYDTGNSYQYFVSAGFGSGSSLKIQCKKTPTTGVQSVSVSVTGYQTPYDARQQGSSNRLDTIDTRIKNGVVRNGILYCAHGIRNGTRTSVRWYEIDLGGWPDSGTPTVLQEGLLDLGSGVYSWFPDIHADAFGDITISYNRSASTEYPSIEAAYQLLGDAPNSMQAPIRLQTSSTAYTGDRYGDYAGVEEDPASPGTFWSHLEYSVGPWETWISSWAVRTEPGTGYCFGDPGSGTPCPCNNDNDGSVPGSGCDNGYNSSGGQLRATGVASVAADTMVLASTGLEPTKAGLFFQANSPLNGGAGNLFGDGLRCAGFGLIRLQTRIADAAGASNTTIAIAVEGGVAPGDTKYYQHWYRTPSASPCGSDFNLTNGYEVTWLP